MADKAISELIEAERITATDMFVLEQSGTAKKLTGQVLLNWLTAAADGHGGIQSIAKQNTNGLVDTYRITLADTTVFDFAVTNGKGVNSITKTKTSGLVDTYTISYNDNTSSKFTVTNGEKGDKGDNQYVWIKYASQKPTASSHSFGDVADNWIGVYSGSSEVAPTDWEQYEWFEIKGEKGDTGSPATLNSSSVEYQVSDSGTVIPSGTWSASVPVVAQGYYLWTRTTNSFNTGDPVVSYSVARMGLDGSGTVSAVAGVYPNADGNVPLTANDVGARPDTWMPTAAQVGAVPTTRTVNGKALTADISLKASDVGATTQEQVSAMIEDAQSTSYSPVLNLTTANNTLSADMNGKTLMCRVTDEAFKLTISKEVHDTLPVGFEFALAYWNAASSVKIYLTGGISACMANEGAVENATLALPGRYSMVALKKCTSQSWLVTGDVEVV